MLIRRRSLRPLGKMMGALLVLALITGILSSLSDPCEIYAESGYVPVAV